MADSSESRISGDVPAQGVLLGVDFGTKRVGLAVSTGDQTIASPLQIYTRRNPQLDARSYRDVVEDYRVKGLVLGLPMHVSGEEGQSARLAREYGTWMSTTLQLPVAYWDERYTSSVAEDYLLGAEFTKLQRKRRIDMVAAQIMLQSFLDWRRRPSIDPEEGLDANPVDHDS